MSDNIGVIVAGAVGAFGNNRVRLARSIGPIVANITIEEQHTDELTITDHPVEQGAAISDHAFKRPAELVIKCAWSNSSSTPGSLLSSIIGALGQKLSGSLQNQLTGHAADAIGGSALGNLAVGKLSDLLGNQLISAGAQVNTGSGKGTTTVQDVYQQLLALQASAVPIDIYTGKRKYSSMVITQIKTDTDIRTENSLVCLLTCRQVLIVRTSIVAVDAAPIDQVAPEKTSPTVDAGTKQIIPVQADANLRLSQYLDSLIGAP